MTRKNNAQDCDSEYSGFYADLFTREERERIAAGQDGPSLDDELWLQRVLNRRLIQALAEAPEGEKNPRLLQLIKAVQVLSAATGRVARLLRDKRLLTGDVGDDLAEVVSRVLDELSREFGREL